MLYGSFLAHSTLASYLHMVVYMWVQACMLSRFSSVQLCDPMDCSPPSSSVHGDSPGKTTGVGCHFLLQGIFPIQRLNLCLLHLLHCQVDYLPPVPPCCSVAQSCLILCNPIDCSTPGFPVHHQLPEPTQTCVGDAIQPSPPLSFPFLPSFTLSQHEGLFQ